jgi:RNA polymerase sigma-54 factor
LQPRLNVKLTQRQVLTPGLVQMVAVLALNKLELREMIHGELVENPVLEEIEELAESLDDRMGREGDRERAVAEQAGVSAEAGTVEERREADPFDEIDFGSYFQEYLDPGYKTVPSYDDPERPSFESFLSQPSSLSSHLLWQAGSLTLDEGMRAAVELVVGNLNEDGYLTASVEELAESLGEELGDEPAGDDLLTLVERARALVTQLDPVGVGARDLRECLLLQIQARLNEGAGRPRQKETAALEIAAVIVEGHLELLQRRDMRELVRVCRRPAAMVTEAVELIRRLDPRPGQRHSAEQTRLIEPDVAFVKRGEQYVVVMNEDDLPNLRLNSGYRRMMREKGVDRDVREYVKERYKSAIQLLRNIEQRKNTIVRACESIVRRQGEFLERGVEGLRPMMIKEVAEEIGVHPSTVSRAVANKYVHTAQGVYELRFFFSEGVNGPEGGDLPLLLLKRKVKKLIEEEDPRRPLTDDHLAAELQRQGIQVTRRTVAKYREDMHIPSTHQRRSRE